MSHCGSLRNSKLCLILHDYWTSNGATLTISLWVDGYAVLVISYTRKATKFQKSNSIDYNNGVNPKSSGHNKTCLPF